MSKTLIFLLIGLIFGAGLGFLLGSSISAPTPVPEMASDMAHDHDAHDHGDGSAPHDALLDVDTPAPQITLTLHPDGPQSRNLQIAVTNFTFDPEGVNGPHIPGKGHAHVYINGIKQARAYAPWVQLYALPKGTHDIRVTLNANDHRQIAVDGQPVESTTTLTID